MVSDTPTAARIANHLKYASVEITMVAIGFRLQLNGIKTNN